MPLPKVYKLCCVSSVTALFSLICFAQLFRKYNMCCIYLLVIPFFLSFISPKPKTEAMVRSPPVMSPSTASQMDSKMPNQGKPGNTGSQSQSSPCDPKTLGTKGAQNVAGGMGLKNGQGLNSGPSSKVKVKRERSTSVESFEQPESGTPTSDDKGNSHYRQMLSI